MKKTRIISLFMTLVMLLGCFAGIGAMADDDTIKIGMVGCLTGDYAIYGLAVRNGTELYVDWLNENGGINGKQVELIIYDNRADNAEAITAFLSMYDEGIVGLVGDVLTGNTQAVVSEAWPLNFPMITPSATAESVTYDAETDTVYTNVFRTCFIDPFQGEKMAQYAFEVLGAKTAAVLYDTANDYSIGLTEAFQAKCEELGIEVVDVEGYATGDKDFKSQLTNIASYNPDVVFAPIYYQDAGLIITQARQLDITSTFLGGDGWSGVTGYASAADLEGTVYCSAYASGTSDAVIAFEDAYIAAYGTDTLNMFAANAYDAAMVLCNAIAIADAADLEEGSEEYSQAVIDAIRDMSGDLEGITSPAGYAFDEFNNPIKDAVIIEVIEGVETFDRLF